MNLIRLKKNIGYMLSSSLMIQLINFAALPILTRSYSVESWGYFSLYLSFIAIITPITNLSYSSAIVTVKNDLQIRAIVKFSIILSIMISLFTFFIINFYNEVRKDNIPLFFSIIPIIVCLQDVLYNIMSRNMLFKKTSIINFIGSFLNVSTSLSLFYFNYNKEYGLIWGNLTMYLFQIIGFYFFTHRHSYFIYNIKFSYIRMVIEKYKDFGYYRFPQSFLASFSQSLPVLMLGSYSSIHASGQYMMARKLVGIPSLFLGKVLSRVFYSEVSSSIKNGEKIFTSLIKSVFSLSLLSLPIFIILFIYGEDILIKLLGEQWQGAGLYSGYLSLWLFFALINKPVTSSIPALNLQRNFFIYEVLLMLTRAFVLFLGIIVIEDISLSILFFSIVGMIFNIYLMAFILLRIYREENENIICSSKISH